MCIPDAAIPPADSPDRYGYWNEKMTMYRGQQWRFHPQACPTNARDQPGGYAATAASSWIRSNIPPFNSKKNTEGLVCDFIENDELGDRSFNKRMFDPQGVSGVPHHVVIPSSQPNTRVPCFTIMKTA